MNQQIKQQWTDALTSGEYKQQRDGQLHTPDGWCCLGVLCNIYSEEKGIDWRYMYGVETIHVESELLPKEVAEWAGFNAKELNPRSSDVIVKYLARNVPLSTLNDSYQLSFAEIAGLIQEQL